MKRDVLHLLIKLNAIYIFCTFHLLGHVSILFLAAVRFCLLFFQKVFVLGECGTTQNCSGMNKRTAGKTVGFIIELASGVVSVCRTTRPI